jgi:glutamate 5-kinase
MIRGRADLRASKRVVIKAGTSIVSTPEGYPSLSRIAAIVEQVTLLLFASPAACTLALLPAPPSSPLPQVAFLKQEGKDVLVVTSGAVGVGRQVRGAIQNCVPVLVF